MLSKYKVTVDGKLLSEIKLLSSEKRLLLRDLFINYYKFLFTVSMIRGVFKLPFLINTLVISLSLIATDLYTGRMISQYIPQYQVLVFLLIGLAYSLYRTFRGIDIKASPLLEEVSPLKRPDGSLFFIVYFVNTFNGDVYSREVWTGERFFWENLKEKKEGEF